MGPWRRAGEMESVIRTEVWRAAVLRFLSLGCWGTSGGRYLESVGNMDQAPGQRRIWTSITYYHMFPSKG